jgi:hypothetical protein
MGGKRWTKEEVKILRKNYSNLSKEELEKLLPERNWMTINKKASDIGLEKDRMWKQEEIDILKNNYNLSISELLNLLPNRTKNSIRSKLSIKNLKKDTHKTVWIKEEIKILKNNYGIINENQLLELLPNKTLKQIKSKVGKLKLKKGHKKVYWSQEEIKLLNTYKYIDDLIHNLRNKTRPQIYLKIKELDLKIIMINNRWDNNNNEELSKYYHLETKLELQNRFNISWYSINKRANELNLGTRKHDDALLIKRKELETGKRICARCGIEKELNFENYAIDNDIRTRLNYKYVCRSCEEEKYPRKTSIRHGEKISFTIEEIIDLYCNDGWALNSLAKKFHRSQKFFKELLLENNIALRTPEEQSFFKNKSILEPLTNELINNYLNNFYSLKELEDKYNVNHESIKYYLSKLNIKIRSCGETQSLKEFRDIILPNKDNIIEDYYNYGAHKASIMNNMRRETLYRLLEHENIDRIYKSFYIMGKYYSKRFDKHFLYRSSYERDYFNILENDNNILYYKYEKLKIPYFYKDKWKNYIPDFIIYYKNGDIEIHEVKPLRLIEISNKIKIKAQYAIEYCNIHNMVYKFITEKEIYRGDNLNG